jgi:endonuclease/exonuclease/phosphatase (EEP) superfamily protein YafD
MAPIKPQKPKRSYRAVIESLTQVWRIEAVSDEACIWQMGIPELQAFSPDRIRVSVWNMCKGVGGVLFEHDYRALCYRSDLILTQEALLSKRSMQLFCERGFESVHAASYKRRDGLRDGVMTVARARASLPLQRIVCKYPEPFLKTPKVALIKSYALEGRRDRLMVINIHATLIRSIQAAAEEMEHLLSHIPAHDGPIILAGDFNTFTFGYLSAISEVLGRVGLRFVPIPRDPRPNIQALDQVFVRGLDVESISVDTTIKNSDHFPLLMTLKIK